MVFKARSIHLGSGRGTEVKHTPHDQEFAGSNPAGYSEFFFLSLSLLNVQNPGASLSVTQKAI